MYTVKLTQSNSFSLRLINLLKPPAHVWVEEPHQDEMPEGNDSKKDVFYQLCLYEFPKASEGDYKVDCHELIKIKLQ